MHFLVGSLMTCDVVFVGVGLMPGTHLLGVTDGDDIFHEGSREVGHGGLGCFCVDFCTYGRCDAREPGEGRGGDVRKSYH